MPPRSSRSSRSSRSRRRNQQPETTPETIFGEPASGSVELSSVDFRNLLAQINMFARGFSAETADTADENRRITENIWNWVENNTYEREETPETERRPRVRVQRNASPLPAVRNIIRRTFSQNPTRIKEKARRLNQNALLFEGLDNALVGVDVATGNAVYEKNLIIAILMERDHLTYEEADSFYETELEAIIDESDGPMIIDLGEDQGEELVTSKPKEKKKKKTKKSTKVISPENTNPILGLDL